LFRANKKPVEKLTLNPAGTGRSGSRALRQLLDGLRFFARGRKCRGMVLPPENFQTTDAVDSFIIYRELKKCQYECCQFSIFGLRRPAGAHTQASDAE
jgi:hypothetical protein